jgi:hypothetical protein
LSRPPDPTGRVGRACATDRVRILKVETEHASASTRIGPKLMKLKTMILPSVLKLSRQWDLKWSD